MTTACDNRPSIHGYELTETLYQGAKTSVYRALRLVDEQAVVIKLLRQEYPTFGELLHFCNQYTITKNLQSPGIIRPLCLETYRHSYALVMEDFGGISLREYTQTQSLDLGEFLVLALQLADILHYLYQNRVIHKDIKPANILIHPETKQVKLIDFSISSLLPKETQSIKNPQVLEGTLAYISPEQTGRMNRGIDYRSDFYSLGITFFELLTGQLPFISDDVMELVHCHIAKMPPTLCELKIKNETLKISQSISEIVIKLMAKNAEDRYQSAWGLKYDLEKCLQQWQETGEVEYFEIGKRDICDRFMIPEKLYGREAEVQQLLEAFERVSLGDSELMLVAGFSGIGKTAVVNEVHKPIVRQRGYFIKGKYDQFQRNIPFSAFVQAFRDLMGQLLSESDAQLQEWKTKILSALGESGQVIIEVIPELDRIIGQQPSVPELSGIAAQNRFNLLFHKFISVFTIKEHPLVMFLDDLQWIDSASLNLMKLLMKESQSGYLLLIGAYRDNEVSTVHPLMLTLDEISKAGATIDTITLQPLSQTSLNHLVADTLNCAKELAQPLTELVAQKTQRNPFFATQFLKVLHQDGLISFDLKTGHWQCDIVRVREAALTDNVVEFMSQQLQKLPTETQAVLKLAACIGNQFDLNTLAIASEQSATEAATALWKALQAGLILPQSEVYKFYQDASLTDIQMTNDREQMTASYKFLHDRIQQAAYSLIPEEQKQSSHLKIGRSLLYSIPEPEQAENIFDIINQLNPGRALIDDIMEQSQLAQLNLVAGKKAKASTAYTAAAEYSLIGLELLAADSWKHQYRLTLALHNLASESAYLDGNFEQMQQLTEIIIKQAKTLLDKVPVYEIQITACIVQIKPLEAIQIALSILRQLSINFPEQATSSDIQQGLEQVIEHLNGTSIADLVHLPIMTHPENIAAMKILMRVLPAAFQSNPVMVPLITFEMVKLSVKYGNAPVSAYGYSLYGLLLCGAFADIDAGSEFGKLALNLLAHFNCPELKAKIFTVVTAHIAHWQQHIRETLSPAIEGYAAGLETGDLEYAGYCAYIYPVHSFWLGKELETLEKDFALYIESLRQIKQQVAFNWNCIYQQSVFNLQGKSEHLYSLIGTAYDEEKMLPLHQKANDLYTINHLFLNKLLLCYLFDRYELALNNAEIAEKSLGGVTGLVVVPLFYFYDSLVRLALYHQIQPSEQKSWLDKIQNNQKNIEIWANYAPMNHLHKLNLVEAEKYQILGQKTEAIEYYDRAISGAKENGYIQEEALANELAAKFYLNWGKEKVAAGYMQEAYYCYAKWGAKAKTDDLEKRYPELLRPILQQAAQALNPLETLASLATPNLSLHTSTSTSRSSGTNINTALDFAAVLKASQSLSGTIQLDELLYQLTQIILQNSGGDRCALILPNGEGRWQIKAIATPEKTELCSEFLDNHPNLPIKLIQYVKRTQEVVVVDRLKTNLPVICEYLNRQQPKSILCLPILNQGKLLGILYLKNGSTSGVFTSDRILILNFLCTQAAISLENARLYQQAQDYAQQLEQSQLQLVQSEKMSALGNLVAGVAHEINNPVGFIAGNLKPAQDYVQDLLGLIDLYEKEYPQPSATIEEEIEAIDLEFIREDLPKLIGSMKEGTDRISHISTSLRTFSRADSDRPTRFNLHDGIDSSILILKHRLKANEHRPAIEVIKNYGDLPDVNCFAGQLNQVFMNIIANAIDAIDEGIGKDSSSIPCIHIQTEALEKSVIIRIKDNAMGMPENVKSRIFNHLFTTKGVGKGTGLGLAIARQIIVEKHGGVIHVESIPGEGTEFQIQIPIYSNYSI